MPKSSFSFTFVVAITIKIVDDTLQSTHANFSHSNHHSKYDRISCLNRGHPDYVKPYHLPLCLVIGVVLLGLLRSPGNGWAPFIENDIEPGEFCSF